MAISKDTTNITVPRYRGRFAPSPTGPLHFGSLVAAVGSYLEARRQGGQWLLRMEDLDPPREMPGAAEGIVQILEDFGFEWDEAIEYQSRRITHYQAALDRLIDGQLVYPCACSRKEIMDSSLRGIDGPIYPGTCRNGLAVGRKARTWRLRVVDRTTCFDDAIQGKQQQNLKQAVGDFVLLRADGFFAYQLAVVVDDAMQGITHIVRGADLLDSTARQIELQNCLNLPVLKYAHLPVVVNQLGEKLSKQTRAAPLELNRASAQIHAALTCLGQLPELSLAKAPLAEVWAWAFENWTLKGVPQQRIMQMSEN